MIFGELEVVGPLSAEAARAPELSSPPGPVLPVLQELRKSPISSARAAPQQVRNDYSSGVTKSNPIQKPYATNSRSPRSSIVYPYCIVQFPP